MFDIEGKSKEYFTFIKSYGKQISQIAEKETGKSKTSGEESGKAGEKRESYKRP